MPIYEYEPDGSGCDFCQGGFEIFQSSAAEPLTNCPECDAPCHKKFSAFAVSNTPRNLLSSENLSKHGWTQYEKKDKGHYERSGGKDGPKTLKT